MTRSGMHVNVETKTALLKGYAHSGVMLKGAELFKGMCLSKGKCVMCLPMTSVMFWLNCIRLTMFGPMHTMIKDK